MAISPKPGLPLQGLWEALPLIAEDLGVITPEVDELRQELGLPGMRIMQFAFGGAAEERFLPHDHERRTVVYTGAHDNNDHGCVGIEELAPGGAAPLPQVCSRLRRQGPAWDLIRLAWAPGRGAAHVTPLQDVLGHGQRGANEHAGPPEWQLALARDRRTDRRRRLGQACGADNDVSALTRGGVRDDDARRPSGPTAPSSSKLHVRAFHDSDGRSASAA